MKLDGNKIKDKMEQGWKYLSRYHSIIFFVFLALIYGFLIFKINSLSNQQPSDDEVSAQITRTSTPRIDESVVKKIEQLQDNSVQVKSLFNEARKNPFSE